MRFYWRPLIPGEEDRELLWGVILGVSSTLALTWLWSGLPTPLCAFHTLTGLPCPTCGMTRGLHCLLLGDPVSAFLFNPLGMIVLLGLVLYLLYTVIVVTARLSRLRWEPLTQQAKYALRITIALLVLLNWAYLIVHEKFITVSS